MYSYMLYIFIVYTKGCSTSYLLWPGLRPLSQLESSTWISFRAESEPNPVGRPRPVVLYQTGPPGEKLHFNEIFHILDG